MAERPVLKRIIARCHFGVPDRLPAAGIEMRQKAWRWFFRLTMCVVLLCVALYGYFLFAMSRPFVLQSDGWLTINATVSPQTLSETFPASATRFRFARSSVGLGGRFLAYAVDGEKNDLQAFALREFASHPDAPEVKVQHEVQSPFDADQIAFLESAYAVELDWLLAVQRSRGSVFHDAGERTTHMPTIFIDSHNAILYLVRTD